MDINDIVMISMYNYVSNEEIEYDYMYEKLCNDIALYINDKYIDDLNLNSEKTKQLIMHFLTVELDIEKFIRLEQSIMDMCINDDILETEDKLYNNKISHEIIKVYQNINQEQIIVDILNKINFKQKIKSR